MTQKETDAAAIGSTTRPLSRVIPLQPQYETVALDPRTHILRAPKTIRLGPESARALTSPIRRHLPAE
jgi:hypothetical protein